MSKREELVRELRERASNSRQSGWDGDAELDERAAHMLSTLDARTVEREHLLSQIRSVCDVIELAIDFLRDAAKACPELLKHCDIDAFRTSELVPALLKTRDVIRALSPEEHAVPRGEPAGLHTSASTITEEVRTPAGTAPNTQGRGMPSEAARYFQMGLAMVESHNTFDGKSEGQWVEAKNYDTLRQFAEGVAESVRLETREECAKILEDTMAAIKQTNSNAAGDWTDPRYADQYALLWRQVVKFRNPTWTSYGAALQSREEGK